MEEVEGKVWIYDIEALYDYFCVTFRDRYSDEKRFFEIWSEQNDLEALLDFLDTGHCSGLIGFNNISYDWPVLNYIRIARRKLFRLMNGREIAMDIAQFSNKIISQTYSAVRDPAIPQLDLFKIHHFDNKNKSMSLKALQIAMNWPLVADMPIHHTDYVDTVEKRNMIVEYNDNDVLSTKLFAEKSVKDIELRKSLGSIFGIDLMNANESKIGEEIILTKISKLTNIPIEFLRKHNTKRDSVALRDCMLPMTFKSPEFQKAQSAFEEIVLDTSIKEEGYKKTKEEKASEEMYSCLYDGVRYDFGLGGLHGLKSPGVYSSDSEHVIMSIDVSSYYAYLAIRNGFKPEHLSDSFGIVYPEIYEERIKYPKGTTENKGLKIALVSVFGKSKSQWSPLYDPKYTLQTTVNGQLLLAWLAEDITSSSGSHVVMANTDGLEILVKRSEIDLVQSICKQWEAKTGLSLESKRYKQIFTRDINNYIGVTEDGKTYNKGAYEFENLEYSKDHSMLAVPYAVQQYLTKGQSLEKSFLECEPHMFYIGKRAKSGGHFQIRQVENFDLFNEGIGGEIRTINYSRTIRYLIAKTGGYLLKKEENSKKYSRIDSPWKVIDCMDVRNVNMDELREKIDYRYYKHEAIKLLKPILNRQMSLS